MEAGDLKSQFEELQLKQHQKYVERMKAKNQERSTSQVSESLSFGLGDDLNLTTGDVSSSSIAGLHTVLEDANTRMREEIRELKDETGRLRKQLAEKDYDIKRLNRTIQKMEEDKNLLASAGVVSDSAAVKIVDLSKRNRELTSEKEAEKTKSLKLLKRIAELERNNQSEYSDTPKKKHSPRNTLALHPEVQSENIEELQDKLQSTSIKMAEYRNHIQELKQELKIAKKVLQQEIGETPSSIQLMLNSGGTGFRGRSQQITALSDKVRDLEQKLKAVSGRRDQVKPDKNLERIRNMEKQKKEQTDELRMEITKVNELNTDLQKKMDATKARNRVLMNETKSLKSQIAVLTDKGMHDNELIKTLMRQHENLQRIVERNVNAKDNIERAGIVFSKEVNNRQQQEQAEIIRLRQLLTERDNKLRLLEQNIEDSVSQANNRSLRDSIDSNHSFLNQESTVPVIPSITIPHEKKSETPDRLMSGKPEDNSALPHQICDLRVELTKYQALYKSASMGQEKLSEIVNILTERIEQSTRSCQELNRILNDEKREYARLERAMEQFKSPTKQDPGGKEASPSRVPPETRMSELQTLLSIQADENAALKESLESTLHAKREDIALFHEMMEQTKIVFLDALKSLSSRNP